MNVDTGFNNDTLQATAGAVLRNSKGHFIAVGNWKIDGSANALMAEASALRFGLPLAQATGCNRTVMNSDNIED